MTVAHGNDPPTSKSLAKTSDTEDLRRRLAIAEQQGEESDRYLAAISEVLKVIGRPPADLNEMFATIAAKARELCRAEWGHVVRYDGALVHLEAVSKLNSRSLEHLEDEIQRHYPRIISTSGTVDRAIAERQVIYNKDAMTDAAYEYVDALRIIDTRSLLAVPMLHEEKTLGAIMIAATEEEAFDNRQIELLKSFADQAVIAIESARLFEEEQDRSSELQEALEYQTATAEVLGVISRSPNKLQPILEAITERAARLCEATDAVALLRIGDWLEHRAHFGPILLDVAGLPLARSTVSARCVVERKTIHVHDIQTAQENYSEGFEIAARVGYHTVLGAPLIRDNEAIGSLVLRRMEIKPFSERQIALLQTFADQAVIAIENARLFEAEQERTAELTRSLDQQTAISRVLSVISRSPSELESVLDEIVSCARELCNAQYACIFGLNEDDGKYHVQASSAASAQLFDYAKSNPIMANRQSVSGRAIIEKRTIHLLDPLSDPDVTYNAADKDQGSSVRLCVPLIIDDEVIGVLALIREELKAFNQREIDVVETFADQAVIAIENARLFEAEQERSSELQESLEYQTATSDVLNSIAQSTTDTQPVFDSIVTNAARLCEADLSAITLFDGEMLEFVALNNVNDETAAQLRAAYPRLPDRTSVAGRIILTGEIVQVDNVLEDPEFDQAVANAGRYRSTFGVPMVSQGRTIGTINVARQKCEPFAARQIALLSTFADQAVIAIENARLFEAEQERTQELEEALEYQTASSTILRTISNSPGHAEPVFEEILRNACELCTAEYGHLVLYDGENWRATALQNVPAAYADWWAGRLVETEPGSLMENLLRTRSPYQVEDAADLQDDISLKPLRKAAVELGQMRTMMGVPLLKHGQVIGAIVVYRKVVSPFDYAQIALLSHFADQAVIAIDNARLFQAEHERSRELQESLDYQTAAADVLSVISRSPDQLQPVLDVIVQTAGRLCKADYALFFQDFGDGFVVTANDKAAEDIVEYFNANPLTPTRGSIVGRAALSQVTTHIPDFLADPEHVTTDRQRVSATRTGLGVPLVRDGKTIGVIFVGRKNVSPFSDRQIGLISTFANQALIAMNNVGLFDELEARTKELEETVEYQTATSDVLEAIAGSATDTQPVFDAILTNALRLCGMDYGTVILSDCGQADVVASQSIDEDALGMIRSHFPRPLERDFMAGRAMLDRKTMHIGDIREDPNYLQSMAAVGGWRTMMAVPLIRQGKAVGAISMAKSEVSPCTERQIALLETFARQAVIAIENARLFEAEQERSRELQETLEYQTATSDVLRSIASSATDAEPVFEAISSNAARLCNAEFCSIYLRDGDALRPVALHNLNSKAQSLAHSRNPMEDNRSLISSRVLETGNIVEVSDILKDPEYPIELAEAGGWRSIAGVPLLSSGQAIGAIAVAKSEPLRFDRKQIKLVETFARQAVIAIENARLFEAEQERTKELQESLEYQTATSNVLGAIAQSATETQPVFDAVVSNAARLCDAEFSLVVLYDGELMHIAAFNNIDGASATAVQAYYPARPEKAQMVGRAILSGEIVHVSDVLQDEDYSPTLAKSGDWRSIMGVPLKSKGQTVGAIAVARRNPTPFADRHVDLISTFARQAVIAIENARLFEAEQERRKELQESVAQLEALGSVGQIVSSSLDLQLVLQTVLENATRMANAGGGTVYVFDREANEFVLAAGHNMSEEHIEQVRAQPIRRGEPVIGECAEQQRAVQIEDLNEYDGEATPLVDILLRGGVRSVLAIPLLHQNSVIGALVIHRNYPGPYAPETTQLLEAFAAQSAIAVNNASLFKEVEETGRALAVASEHKSQFLANMSHELRTPLNAILGYTELIQDGIYGEPEKKVSEVLGRVQSNGKHLLGLINDVLDLSKIEAGQVELTRDGYSLSDAIQTVIAATESLATEKNLELKTDIEQSLPAGLGDERRLVQVLLNLVGNAIKFTDEGSVTIYASQRDGRFNIAVADTGPGIPDDELARIFEEFHQVDSSATKRKGGTGLGLAISKRIVELHGGELTVTSELGVGSTFNVELPIRLSKQQSI